MQQTLSNGGNTLVVNHTAGGNGPGVLFCGGFNSSRNGQKALALEAICTKQNIAYTRFDYSGHGDSTGEFATGSIDTWLSDTLCVLDNIDSAPKQIIIGSSMGAWIAVLAALQRKERLAGLITIAAAPDFTQRLMKQRFTAEQLVRFEQQGLVMLPSQYDDGSPYPISRKLIEESRQHCVLNRALDFDVPIRMLHGTADIDVPYQLSIELLETINAPDLQLTLIKNGDHRLSEPEHLAELEQTLLQLL